MPSRLLTALILLVILPAANALAAASEKRVALVIGNGKYPSAPLSNPANDAEDMAIVLKKLGFEVILRRDAGRKAMAQAVKEFYQKLQENKGIGLFYYAGHGIQVRGQNYLVPVDAEIESEGDVDFSAVEAGWVLRKMEDAQNPVNIVILDACRNNPFTRGFRSVERGLAQMPSPTGSIIAYATAPGEVAADGEGRNGLYTKHLLRHLPRPGVEIKEVFSRVTYDVHAESGRKQTPWISSSLMRPVSLATGTTTIETGPAEPAGLQPGGEDPLKAQRERLEREKRELEELRVKVEAKERQTAEQARIEAELRKLEQERQALLEKTKASPVPSPAPAAPGRTKNGLGMEFVWIAPGSFEMGSPPGETGRSPDETQHRVTLTRGYYLQTTEVTQGQWKAVMGSNPSGFSNCGDDCPVECVNWIDVVGFISRLNARGEGSYRLPTEAEWEYACRAGSGGRFNFGDDENRLSEYAWYNGNSGWKTHPVATRKANDWGLFDMHGNVWEWCSDWKEGYPSGAVNDPNGPNGGSDRVNRGGSMNSWPVLVRSAYRYWFFPGYASNNLGFRLARTD